MPGPDAPDKIDAATEARAGLGSRKLTGEAWESLGALCVESRHIVSSHHMNTHHVALQVHYMIGLVDLMLQSTT